VLYIYDAHQLDVGGRNIWFFPLLGLYKSEKTSKLCVDSGLFLCCIMYFVYDLIITKNPVKRWWDAHIKKSWYNESPSCNSKINHSRAQAVLMV